ncbi:hypothetical protein ACHAPO_000060 [Fusarium lateritium]
MACASHQKYRHRSMDVLRLTETCLQLSPVLRTLIPTNTLELGDQHFESWTSPYRSFTCALEANLKARRGGVPGQSRVFLELHTMEASGFQESFPHKPM